MIALTQEKREELIAYNSKKLKGLKHSVKQTAFESVRQELELEIEIESMELTLASLTAEPIAHADSKAILKMTKRHTRFFTSFPERSEAKRVGLFIAPPVPEIKLPETIPSMDQDSEHDTGHTDGWNECLAEIKRLNGLG
ncbi:hypothetical protein [Rosenbergiella epipactidis]|uniref:hypothetical protein n=1 Tax=Rosenbergiella epipactidis TaxID=1544694 RepID=UPI001F4EAC17|nr:hypothetical protein [Rosenbergiella epipactidis]